MIIILSCLILLWTLLYISIAKQGRIRTLLLYKINTAVHPAKRLQNKQFSNEHILNRIMAWYYWGGALILSFTFIGLTPVSVMSMIQVNIGLSHILLTLLAFLSVFSLSSLIIYFYYIFGIIKNLDKAGESIDKVVWISHIYEMKSRTKRVIAVVISTLCEEWLFRGILLHLIYMYTANVWVSIIFVSLLFVLQQCLCLSSKNQMLIIGTSAFLISIFGSLLIFITGTIFYSFILHGLFAAYYIGDKND